MTMKNNNAIYPGLEPSLQPGIPKELFGLMDWIQGYYPALCPGQVAQVPLVRPNGPSLPPETGSSKDLFNPTTWR